MLKSDLITKINALKKQKNAIILAHSYQNIEIDEVADFVGDSLELSRKAKSTNADIIVFAGVYFMAETAKILSPDKKVLLPKKEAGCEMADTIDSQKLKQFKVKYPNTPVVCYINSSADVKALSDICCTSSNAVNIVNSLPQKQILFVPDKNLASYVQSQLPNKEIIAFDGCCPIHDRISVSDINQAKAVHPSALVLTHPECRKEILEISDFIGSTKKIFEYVQKSEEKEFIIVTERGVVERLQRDYNDKDFYLISPQAVCKNMKYTTLEDILTSLEEESFDIVLKDETTNLASRAICRMLSVR